MPERTSPRTEGELLSENNFRVTINWLKPIALFVRQGYRNPKMSGFNAAHSFLSREALIKDGFGSYIDPVLAKVSSGNLALAEDLQVELNEEQQLVFSWNSRLVPNSNPRDRIMMLAYNIEKKTARYEVSGARRTAGQDILTLPAQVSGTYHIYAAFVTEDARRQSDSVYLGSVEL